MERSDFQRRFNFLEKQFGYRGGTLISDELDHVFSNLYGVWDQHDFFISTEYMKVGDPKGKLNKVTVYVFSPEYVVKHTVEKLKTYSRKMTEIYKFRLASCMSFEKNDESEIQKLRIVFGDEEFIVERRWEDEINRYNKIFSSKNMTQKELIEYVDNSYTEVEDMYNYCLEIYSPDKEKDNY